MPLETLTLDSPPHYRGDLLTPDDKKRLAANIRGYDISPDMVRLSLVNMYLHGFASPHIDEYDTLTSDEKWNELADVILANPPFMSPKGGIKPHKRFSVAATRSEVLFVDYIAEHLTPNGRAAVIVPVPEGIIFQSGKAYKQLREMLVKQYLVAVISLPAGVFNPYSGVKTSILLLDKRLAKKTDAILFAKIGNDGYNLGAQRRPIDHNDLPAAVRNIKGWLESVRNRAAFDVERIANFNVVSKERISEEGEWNLSGERYRDRAVQTTEWPMVELGEVATLINGRAYKREELLDEGSTPVIRVGNFFSNREWYYSDLLLEENKYCNKGDLLYAWSASFGPRIWDGPRAIFHYHIWKIETSDKIDKKFLYYLLQLDSEKIKSEGHGIAMIHVTKSGMERRKFPLPSLEVQKKIVAEIEGYQKIIDGARQVIENYQPRIPIHPDWPMVELNEVCDVRSGGTPSRSVDAYWNGNIPWVTTTLVDFNRINDANEFITSEGLKESSTWIVPKGTVLMAMYGQGITRGKVAILGIDAAINQACAAFTIKSTALNPDYLFRILESKYEDLRRISDARGGNQSNLSAQVLKQYKIPLPDLDTQRAIVAQLETEQRLVNANKELIRIFENKIKAVINRAWGETA